MKTEINLLISLYGSLFPALSSDASFEIYNQEDHLKHIV